MIRFVRLMIDMYRQRRILKLERQWNRHLIVKNVTLSREPDLYSGIKTICFVEH